MVTYHLGALGALVEVVRLVGAMQDGLVEGMDRQLVLSEVRIAETFLLQWKMIKIKITLINRTKHCKNVRMNFQSFKKHLIKKFGIKQKCTEMKVDISTVTPVRQIGRLLVIMLCVPNRLLEVSDSLAVALIGVACNTALVEELGVGRIDFECR